MKSYQARLKEAQRTIIADMSRDIIAEFGPMLAGHGFTKTGHSHDDQWETIEVTFQDPQRRDEIIITVDCDTHKFGAIYYTPGDKIDADEIEPVSLKRFTAKLGAWLDGLGWDCPVCEGEGEVFPDEECELDPIPCPHCQGTGKTREHVKDKAA